MQILNIFLIPPVLLSKGKKGRGQKLKQGFFFISFLKGVILINKNSTTLFEEIPCDQRKSVNLVTATVWD